MICHAEGIAAVIFDLDNTLYPHQQFVAGAYGELAGFLAGRSGKTPPEILAFMLGLWRAHGSHWPHVFEQTLALCGLAGKVSPAELVARYHQHRPALAAYPGMEPLLAHLARRFALGLLTDGRPATQRGKLTALGLAKYFRAVVITGDLGREFYKPSPAGFREVCRLLGLAPGRALYVGDDPLVDFAGPRSLGMPTIRLRLGEYAGLNGQGPEQTADCEAANVAELAAMLGKEESN